MRAFPEPWKRSAAALPTLCLLLSAAVSSCVSEGGAAPAKGEYGALVWSDEFEVPGKPDAARWTPILGGSGWNAQELQCYVEGNAEIRDGILSIRAIRERALGRDYSSARLSTEGSGTWRYGRIEIRAKFPVGKGLLSFARLLPSSGSSSWPVTGEADVFEYAGLEPGSVRFSLHDASRNAMSGNERSVSVLVGDSAREFHVYAMEWRPDRIDFFVDGTHCLRTKRPKRGKAAVSREEPWPFDEAFHLVLGLAVGGTWAGRDGVDAEAFPVALEIDWVRVWDLGIESAR